MTQVTVGAQVGGQKYSEVIFFKNAAAYDEFVKGTYEMAAQISAVALADGVSQELDELRGISNSGKEYLDNMLARETERTSIPSLKIAFNNVLLIKLSQMLIQLENNYHALYPMIDTFLVLHVPQSIISFCKELEACHFLG